MQPTKPIFMLLSLVLAASLLLSACLPATPTATPDPCSPQNLPNQVEKVQRLMRAFDDTAQLAASTPREQLSSVISALQATRRQTEDFQAPACLETLKHHQLTYMNSVIDTLLAFYGGAPAETLAGGIGYSYSQRVAYDAEWARLLGVTLTPAPTFIIPTAGATANTPTPTPTP